MSVSAESSQKNVSEIFQFTLRLQTEVQSRGQTTGNFIDKSIVVVFRRNTENLQPHNLFGIKSGGGGPGK